MEFFRIKNDIPFMRYALVFNIISLLTFVVAVLFIAFRGLNLSIEFVGGTQVEVKYAEAVQIEPLRQALAKGGYPDAVVQSSGSRNVQIRLPNRDGVATAEVGDLVREMLKEVGGSEIEEFGSDSVGSQVGEELASGGAMALLLVIIGIVAYLAFRFEWRFAVSTVIANLHDGVIVLGFFAFFQWDFSPSVLAAVMAGLGYSVNESVIVFDRVRETFRKRRDMKTPEVINHSITKNISRTIITHGSTLAMVLSMLLFGGEVLRYFALALTIGICFGIYSSVLVASPLVMWLGVSREQFAKVKVQKQEAVV